MYAFAIMRYGVLTKSLSVRQYFFPTTSSVDFFVVFILNFFLGVIVVFVSILFKQN